jgi:hypothetical protein
MTLDNLLIKDFKYLQNESDFIVNNIKNPTIKGEELEILLKRTLEKRIKYKISSGEIENNKGEKSCQHDLIIYDSEKFISFLDSEKNNIFPIEIVYGVIEVNASIKNSEKFKKDVDKIKKLKLLYKSTYPNYPENIPFGFIFSFKEKVKLNTIGDRTDINKLTNDDIMFLPNGIYLLDNGFIGFSSKNNNSPIFNNLPLNLKLDNITYGIYNLENHYSFFIYYLIKLLNEMRLISSQNLLDKYIFKNIF